MIKKIPLFCLGILFTLALTSCATTRPHAEDPLEAYNRQMFQFNMDIDTWVIKPVATVYKKITPWPVRDGVTNFFSNLNDIPGVGNDLLQANFHQALSDTWRVLINSTVGLAGTIDVASKIGLPKHTQDLGLTFARWGWQRSTYIVLPLLGPSTIRDGVGFAINYQTMSVFPYIKNRNLRYSMIVTNMINLRSNLLGSEQIVDEAALDKYIFFRDAYLQKRRNLMDKNAHPVTFNSASSDTVEHADNKKNKKTESDVIKQIESGQLPDN